MRQKIIFNTNIPAKKRIRVNGHGIHHFTETVKLKNDEPRALVTTSEFAKEQKIMVYQDVVLSGDHVFTIINLSPYPVDLETGDHIATLVSLPTRCKCGDKTK